MPPPCILRHIVDVHCHPTDSPITPVAMDQLPITICAMSSRPSDQYLVRDLASRYPEKVIPCFGYHPWFSHWISLKPHVSKEEHYRRLFSPSKEREDTFKTMLSHLPDPVSLQDVLLELRQNLEGFPKAMLGEVGIDRAARIPIDHTTSTVELTPFTVPLEHQLAILEAQMNMAVELGRNISLHSVKSHQATLDLLNRMQEKHKASWLRISIDFHSCGVSTETWKVLEASSTPHRNVFMSLSTAINGRSPSHRSLIAACSSRRILVESDYHAIEECTKRTWDMVLTVAEVKGWSVETTWVDDDIGEEEWGVVRHLKNNWDEFQLGNHTSQRSARCRP
ncbi:hypothetical protein EDD17DRAFT_1697901 [Pisolithus thermaeus]|nr:hypothetical protein EDD17DRAFT_1697901 [Pisolithus thermaeus]